MASNITADYRMNDKIMLIQVFVVLFLCINLLLITTFFTKEFFYTSMRYILFAFTLMSDCLILVVTNVLLIMHLLSLYDTNVVVPYYLYCFVAVHFCDTINSDGDDPGALRGHLPAAASRRAVLPTQRSAQHPLHPQASALCPALFLSPSSLHLPPTAPTSHGRMCSVEIFITHKWQGHLNSAISQFYFLIMFITITFAYVKIMRVAKAASGEDKKSSWRGLRTVVLHAFQLLFCLIQLWLPFIEAAVLQINLMLYHNVRYFNYITFILAPRCLSPLIYGLRDEMFFQALKRLALCGLRKKH